MFRSKVFMVSRPLTLATALALGACATVADSAAGPVPADDAARRESRNDRGPDPLGRRNPQCRHTRRPDLFRDPRARARLDRAPDLARSERRAVSSRAVTGSTIPKNSGKGATSRSSASSTAPRTARSASSTTPIRASLRETIYLWPNRRSYVNTPYYDPWGPWWGYGPYWGGPYWGGPYWGGPTIIVRHPTPSPPPPKGG